MQTTTMEYKGYKAQIMEAERLTGDYVHELPPGRALEVYHSDEFLKWPENWMKHSFLVPVKPNKGLWFNFRMNSEINTAVVMTVKGCNPITGMMTSGFHLERYDTKCPKHNIDFMGDRFCPECNYKWPSQGYITGNPLWFDGFFNSKDGTVRQFFFTEEEMRDIATHMIGKENTCPAFGFAFFKPKEPRQEDTPVYRGFNNVLFCGQELNTYHKSQPITYCHSTTDVKHLKGIRFGSSAGGQSVQSYSGDMNQNAYLASASASAPSAFVGEVRCSSSVDMEKGFGDIVGEIKSSEPIKEVSVGAGARIRQNLKTDPYALDTWCDKPEAVMTIYFVFQDKLEELKAGGLHDLTGKQEGMLSGLPVG